MFVNKFTHIPNCSAEFLQYKAASTPIQNILSCSECLHSTIYHITSLLQSVFNVLGETLARLQQDEEAERWYMAALQAQPDHVPAHITYGKLLAKNVSTHLFMIWSLALSVCSFFPAPDRVETKECICWCEFEIIFRDLWVRIRRTMFGFSNKSVY